MDVDVKFEAEFELSIDEHFFDGDSIEHIRMHLCDKCGTVRSKAKAVKENVKFTWCGHHLRRYAPHLVGLGFNIIDPLDELNFGTSENRLQGADHS